jgi:hypothetical protein
MIDIGRFLARLQQCIPLIWLIPTPNWLSKLSEVYVDCGGSMDVWSM